MQARGQGALENGRGSGPGGPLGARSGRGGHPGYVRADGRPVSALGVRPKGPPGGAGVEALADAGVALKLIHLAGVKLIHPRLRRGGYRFLVVGRDGLSPDRGLVDTFFIVGTGACEGSWDRVSRCHFGNRRAR